MSTVTVNELLEGHVGLDIECLDRIYLNGYVPKLQVAGQVVGFMTRHLGLPIPSPAIMEKIATRFRRAVATFARDSHVPVVKFDKTDRKIDRMRPYVAAQARTGRSGVAAIGVAQEYQNVFAATRREDRGYAGNAVWYSFSKADRRVTCFYFYLWDADFRPAFIKICAYFPYPVKVCLLTELRGGSPQVTGRIGVGAGTVPARDRIRRAVTGSGRVGGASARGVAGQRGSRRAVRAA